MKIIKIIINVIFWFLVAVIPMLLLFIFYETAEMELCKKTEGCVFSDDREFLLKPVFVYSAILLWPLTIIKIFNTLRKSFKNE